MFLYSEHSSNFFHASFSDIWPSSAGFSQISLLHLCKALVCLLSLSLPMYWVSPTQPLLFETFPQSSQWVDFFPCFSRLPHCPYLHVSLDVPVCSKLHVWRHLFLSLTSLRFKSPHFHTLSYLTGTQKSTSKLIHQCFPKPDLVFAFSIFQWKICCVSPSTIYHILPILPPEHFLNPFFSLLLLLLIPIVNLDYCSLQTAS